MPQTPLTPAQQQVVDGLIARDGPRPSYDSSLRDDLRQDLEARLSPVASRLEGTPLSLNKHELAQVHACEAHFVSSREAGFIGWSPPIARGSVAHKAIELRVMGHPAWAPLELVDETMARLEEDGDDPGTLGAYLRSASLGEKAELRGAANDVVAKFTESFPPLSRRWVPRMETPVRADLCDGMIQLYARPDLALGQPLGTQARVLIVDLKTGGGYPSHADDLRFYALVETLRSGVPPFRVASYYLDSGTYRCEDVSLEVLAAAVERTVAGAEKMASLRLREREPTVTPGPSCRWCLLRHSCEGARAWEEEAGSAAW